MISRRAEDCRRTYRPNRDPRTSLYRLMRAVASLGILTEDTTHQFALTSLGEAFRTRAPGSAHATILTLAGDSMWRGWEQMLYSVQTRKSGVEKSLGMPMFEWLAMNPKEASLLSKTTIGVHGSEAPPFPPMTSPA